jgi:hypothetical protein
VRDPVRAQHVDPVPGLRGERRQQQGGVELRVQAGPVPDPGGGRPGGVHDDQHVPVAFGPPGAHDDAAPAGGRAPVDRTDVVTVDEVPQRVELGAGSPLVDGGQSLDLAQAPDP